MAAALVPPLRPVLLVILFAVVVLAPHGSAPCWAAAAGLPVALILLWGAVAGNQARTDLADCSNLLSPPAVARVAEAIVVCGLIALLARWLRVGVVSLRLPRPSRQELALGAVAVETLPPTPAAISYVGGLQMRPLPTVLLVAGRVERS